MAWRQKEIKGKWYEFAPNTASVRRKALTSFWITFSSAAGTTSAEVVAVAAAGAAGRAGGLRNGNGVAIRFEVRGGVSER